ncbi:MAG: helix-turn-helix transcriptional regulator, partial [Williamsia herbipolensis]|nr:helix-turn-helix transcriptional regulator [Williamsia herbipolensis]
MSAAEHGCDTTPRARRRTATRGRLLWAARELFAENGFDDTTVAAIARRAGTAHGLLFHHFGSKHGLYRAVLDEVVAEMDAAFLAGAGDTPEDVIRGGLRGHLRYVAENPTLALQLVAGSRSADTDVRESSQAGRDRVVGVLSSRLGVEVDNPTIVLVARTFVAAVDEASVQWVLGEQSLPLDTLVEWLIKSAAAA